MAAVRTLLMYAAVLAAIRVMGKRQVGQLEPAELVVTMLVADLAATPLEEGTMPLWQGLVPIATIVAAELILSRLILGSSLMRRLLCGKPVILVENGRPIRENMRRARVALDELTEHLRLKDVMDISKVQYAVLETNGDLSVFLFPEHAPAAAGEAGIKTARQSLPVTLIQDGKLCRADLRRQGKDEEWLRKVLRDRKLRQEEVFLLTLTEEQITVFKK